MSTGTPRSYPTTSLFRARELHGLGHAPPQIRRMLVEEELPAPDVRTIHRWVDDNNNRRSLERSRAYHERHGAAMATFRLGGARGGPPTVAYRAAFVDTLIDAGVRREDIERVCAVVLGDATKPLPGRAGRVLTRHHWSAEKTERILGLCLEMRRRKVPYSAISVALELWEGERMRADTLRSWLTLHGAARDPSRSRRTTMANIGQAPRP